MMSAPLKRFDKCRARLTGMQAPTPSKSGQKLASLAQGVGRLASSTFVEALRGSARSVGLEIQESKDGGATWTKFASPGTVDA
jgi:hypothetical protein